MILNLNKVTINFYVFSRFMEHRIVINSKRFHQMGPERRTNDKNGLKVLRRVDPLWSGKIPTTRMSCMRHTHLGKLQLIRVSARIRMCAIEVG